MARFSCPKCQAVVYKESNDPPGCSCCGYGKESNIQTASKARSHCQHCQLEHCEGHVICG